MSHNIYYGKRIFDLSWGLKWPPILGCFVLLWVVALLIAIDLLFCVHARVLLHTLQNILEPQFLLNPAQSVG